MILSEKIIYLGENLDVIASADLSSLSLFHFSFFLQHFWQYIMFSSSFTKNHPFRTPVSSQMQQCHENLHENTCEISGERRRCRETILLWVSAKDVGWNRASFWVGGRSLSAYHSHQPVLQMELTEQTRHDCLWPLTVLIHPSGVHGVDPFFRDLLSSRSSHIKLGLNKYFNIQKSYS